MKKAMLISLICTVVQIFSITVDGYAFLGGETNHSGIEVMLERVVPDSLYGITAYTNSSGYYSGIVEEGYYYVRYSKTEFNSSDTTDVILYSNQTLPSKTLKPQGLTGSISGVLSSGEYNVTGTLTVEAGDSLIIEAGASLYFNDDVQLIVNGYLEAIGSEFNKIHFQPKYDNWSGIIFNPTSNGSIINYCLINSVSTGLSSIAIKIHNHDDPNETNISILNSSITNSGIGIFIDGGFDCILEVDIDNVDIQGKGNTGSGVLVNGSSIVTIKNSKITNFLRSIDCENVMTPCNVSINNSLLEAEQYGLFCNSGDISLINVSVVTAYKGIYSNNGTTEIKNTLIYKNILPHSEDYGLFLNDVYSVYNSNSFGFENNYKCGDYIGSNVTSNSNGDPCDAYGNISMNPQFVSVGANDFRLAKTSPCRDVGNNSYITEEWDIRGIGYSRELDESGNAGIVDIGAYEWNVISDPLSDIHNSENTINIFVLHQNYPNPFNPETTISYSLSNNAQVNIKVYDIAGREVFNLIDSKQSKGLHEVNFDGSMLTSGIYFYKLSIDGKAVENRKMMLLK